MEELEQAVGDLTSAIEDLKSEVVQLNERIRLDGERQAKVFDSLESEIKALREVIASQQ